MIPGILLVTGIGDKKGSWVVLYCFLMWVVASSAIFVFLIDGSGAFGGMLGGALFGSVLGGGAAL